MLVRKSVVNLVAAAMLTALGATQFSGCVIPRTAKKATVGVVKGTGKVVKGAGKAVTKPFRGD